MTWERDCVDRRWQSIRGTWQRRYFDRYYRAHLGWVDGTTRFWRMCQAIAKSGTRILEIGAGPANPTTEFLRTLGEVHGIDIDPAVKSNPYLKTAEIITNSRFPLADTTFDLCVSNFVVEHVKEPITHLSEVKRVLKPGGMYLFRTPNRWHYVSLAARCTPHWFHGLVANAARNLPEKTPDPYPTVYSMNSRRTIRRLATAAGLDIVAMDMHGGGGTFLWDAIAHSVLDVHGIRAARELERTPLVCPRQHLRPAAQAHGFAVRSTFLR